MDIAIPHLGILQSMIKQKPKFIKCINCGKFISFRDIENEKVRFHFIPDGVCGPEESYWEHKQCQ